ncbi:4-hydroxy-tetrahydrodipicolinate synthase [Acidipropionibacterium jensenii]|uniref:4-hydroxy-tetrahydrodipicolinate synthase n=2 Tax=Acidipropionibacterium jensenii TaxID=1749 RepID=A0A448NXH1_9ACTN|nr:4-hydroxy-tetrahydrodipicolinate synthase [Acidipropionibacterium jensenii]MDN6619415.1 4-hydroxy-tetrahydrodipicolinate synthase [Corynebacterium variabile]MDN5996733.1 4-hydroxy-tetrahydrodipicolinate synthase [Acidipropionibacterium jensenii]MDN6021936.1 4-hydroxy-tetrahydrodipicolinate synthase [Acidipropionibacterium jensenii]MDN6427390.1 4-hydroxy-tetrahydrodipicolinate synthase [Acidipropionibacterium jensenii]MDN6442278.1 4-hydroxy-tetrahydrodipicolinate synthase [Acidipropionibacte
MSDPIFGRVLTAMVTPMSPDGEVDLDRAAELATRLVDVQGNDSLLVNGTTGESPTTTDEEKSALVRAVRQAVGDRAQVIAGVGTNDTRHTVALARQAEQAGADGLLVVTPYYSKPSQDGLVGHFTTVADATDLPVMLYDIPGRTGTAIAPETFIRLAEHPRIVAVKDAKGKVVESAQVMAATDLSYYSGDDAITPALLSLGAVGVIGTSTHFTGRSMHQLVDHYLAGRREEGLAVYRQILPVLTGVFAAQGVVMVKAGLAHQGFGVGGVRAPLVPATRSQAETFAAVLDAAGL